MLPTPFLQDDAQGVLLWLLRSALVAGGGWLTNNGYTDAETVKTIIGGVLAAVGLVWSFCARQRALGTDPRR